ncbi:MAG: hypothetical protein HQL24_05555 [Candidatus Omnitrophica bacterium]|nr:hypothetical protein [Candidatus Omnitrophota bacterium]
MKNLKFKNFRISDFKFVSDSVFRIPDLFKRITCLALVVAHLAVFGPVREALAFGATSTSFKLNSGTITVGGSGRSSTSYKVKQDVVGEPSAGKSTSASYVLESGFMPSIKSNPPTQTQTIPNQSWLENETKSNLFDLDNYFSSPDGLALSFTASGTSNIVVAIDPSTHQVSFSQPQAWYGTEKVKFTVSDSDGNTLISNEVTLQVQGVNNPPALDFIADVNINEGDLVTITPHATDLDNDTIAYTFSSPLNAQGQWQTNYASAGIYTVTVTATDPMNLSASRQFKINVRNVNRPPVLNPLSTITANEGDLVVITPVASDPDNDAVMLYYSTPFDSNGRWLTGYNDAGTKAITVTASDGTDTVTQNVNVIINNTNRKPIVNLTASKYTVSPNTTLTITLLASDPDGDALTYSLKKDTQVIGSGVFTNTVTVSTSFADIGDHTFTATVTDSGSLSATQTIGIDVADPLLNQYAINPVMGDFNGDALMDLGLHNSDTGNWEIALSNAGVFTNSVDWLSGFGNSRSWQPTSGDFNGDGKTDVAVYNTATGEFKVALSTGSSFSAQATTWLTFSGASASWQIFTGNFNADKYTDLGFYNKDTGEVKVSLGTGTGFGSLTTWVNNFGTGSVAMSGDFNGDSLSDLCLFKKETGEFRILLSNSQVFVDGSIWISGFAMGLDPILSDFNHDGLTDIGYWDKSTGSWYYAISTGSQFVNKGTWLTSFTAANAESATTGDFNADGIMDRALFDRDAQGINRWIIQLTSGVKIQDLLTTIDNGIGGKTQVTYTYAAASENAELPFPVYVVSSTSLSDTLPSNQPQEVYTQQFTYSGGYYDAAEREFRGFAKVRVTDPITNNYTETYFYQGRPSQDGALKGQIDKIIAYDGNGRQISQIQNTYEVKKAGPDDNILGFPAIIQVDATVWEENGTSLQTRSRLVYDAIGNVTASFDDGEAAKTGDEKSTATTYAPAYDNGSSLGFAAGFNRPLEVSLKDKDGNVVTKKDFEYDIKGNLSRETAAIYNPVSLSSTDVSMSYTYDSFGNIASATDALGHTATTEYENTLYAFPQKVTNALGQSVSSIYDTRFGVATSTTDTNGQTSTTSYDSFGRPVESRNANNDLVVSFSYPDFNTKVTTQGILTKTEYADGLGRKYKAVSNGEDGSSERQVSSEIYYNSRGLVDRESIAHYIDEDAAQISYTRNEYDIRGRLTKTTADFPGEANDAASSVNYVSPLYTETTDAQGHKKGALKDVYGNLIEVTEFTSGGVYKTDYEYDIQKNLTKVTDSKGNVTQLTYDSAGHKVKMVDPDMGTWTYEYDKLGNLTKQTDAKSQVMTFTYDALNRLITKQAGSQTLVTYLYDDVAKQNSVGRLSKVTDQSGSTEFFYDNLGREIKSIKTLDAVPYTVERTYDTLDRLVTLKYPDAEVVTYSYDANSGLLEKVQGAVDYVKDISYNAKGQIKNIQYGNNTSTNYTYGSDLRLSRILTQGVGTLQDLNYVFDKNGNIMTLTDNLRNNIRNFSYDDLDRLTSAQNVPAAGGGYATYNYQYDSIGNMTYKSDVGVMSYGTTIRPHAVTLAGGYSYAYDANGNMTSGKNNQTFAYDAENRIISVASSGVTTTFAYDGDGGRVKKTQASGQTSASTTYIGALFEKNSDGKATKHIFAGSSKVCSIESTGNKYYIHSDHLGSSSVITDQNGQQTAHYEYSPYGVVVQSEGADATNYKFTGKELDNTGLYFYGARYYNPELGRFVTADTIVQAPYNPQTLNRYAYCGNNPFNYVDPSGHFWFVAAIIAIVKAAAVGAVIGAGIAAATSGDISKGALLGAISGVLWSGTSLLINQFKISGGFKLLAYAVGGAASGALGCAAIGTDPGQGAAFGALSGAVFGGISDIGGKSWKWDLGRVVLAGAAGGGISKLAGRPFLDGFVFAASVAGADFVYRTILNVKPECQGRGGSMKTALKDGQPKLDVDGNPLMGMDGKEKVIQKDLDVSNVGVRSRPSYIDLKQKCNNAYIGETGPVMSFVGTTLPGFQGLSFAHDIFGNYVESNLGQSAWGIINIPSMVPIYGLNLAASAINDTPQLLGLSESNDD